MDTKPSVSVATHVDVNSVSIAPEMVVGANVLNVVKYVPDWSTIPDFVDTDPSVLVTSQVDVYSV